MSKDHTTSYESGSLENWFSSLIELGLLEIPIEEDRNTQLFPLLALWS
ncbi:hypothetical protein [Natrinema sp. SYSU A 869]|nr:hypothetical protein [Natrinema sp. SYSU A 869]